MKKLNYKFLLLLEVILLNTLILTSCIEKDEPIPPIAYETYMDVRDGEIYNYVKIGEQYWFAENLRFKPDFGNYWAYENNENSLPKYGYLYDWETACDVCPDGWHLPSDVEWTELVNYLGGFDIAGGKMKENSPRLYWSDPNTGTTNESGFTALPAGSTLGGYFHGAKEFANFWSSTRIAIDRSNYYFIRWDKGKIYRSDVGMLKGLSVRCIKN